MSQLISQPNETDSNDTYINGSAATTNYGSDTNICTGRYGSTTYWYALIRFDLSSIPSDATIDSATMTLRVLNEYLDGAVTMYCRRVKRNWVEGQATWNIYSTGNSWQTAGCQGVDDWDSSTNCGSASIPDPASGDISVTMSATELKKLIDGTYSNYGWKLILSDETLQHAITFHSSSSTTEAYRPKLTVNYTEAGGARFQVIISGAGL